MRRAARRERQQDHRQPRPLSASSLSTRTLLLLVDGGQNRRRDREVPSLEGRPPSVDGRSAARPHLAKREPSVRCSTTLAKCRSSLCDAPRGVAAFGGGPTACTRPRWTRRTHSPASGAARESSRKNGRTREAVPRAHAQRPWLFDVRSMSHAMQPHPEFAMHP